MSLTFFHEILHTRHILKTNDKINTEKLKKAKKSFKNSNRNFM